MPGEQPEWIRLACQRQGERIRQAREHANLTQEQLAERTELHRSTVQRIEAGHGIKYVHLLLIADAVAVPIAELMERPAVPSSTGGEDGTAGLAPATG